MGGQPAIADLAAPSSGRDIRRRTVLRAILRNPAAVLGIALLAVIIAMALLAPIIAPGDPLGIVGPPRLWPGENAAFPLGTDALGRDVLSGVIHGARVSLLVGLASTALGIMGGIAIGAIAGFYGRWVDDLIVRFIEIFQTIPGFVLLVVLVAIAQPSITTVIIGIALVSWDTIARLARSEFRSLREKDFVAAAIGAGFRHRHIMLREIFPNALPPLMVTASIMVASAILNESALSFMGLGDPNVISWGSMIGSGRELLRTHWYLTAIPGGFVALTVLSLNLIGDGLNDALNPHLREARGMSRLVGF
ncbi:MULTISPECIES: ABC transporter permease [unclassified Chelatococcus]|uniref:ABC transporter permease n=1 Tax=unclassified Chelatococcus TaxID=2638111 RepID=UPI0020BF4F1A|nr:MULTISPECIES: ABC transporter permease [unclassified Chelatococcus]